MIIRSSVTLYEDQYKFFKAFNSEKLLVAFVEFMFEDIEPKGLTDQEQVIFDSLRIRMNNQKTKSFAGSIGGKNSHGGGRPKQAENKQKTNTKQAEKQAKNKEVKDKDISICNTNIILTDNTETKSFGNEEINRCLDLIMKYNGGLIDGTKQNGRRYSKLLIDKLNKLEKIKSGEFTRYDTLEIILKVIAKNKYYASKITSPESIYRNLSVLMQQCKADMGKATTSSVVLPVI